LKEREREREDYPNSYLVGFGIHGSNGSGCQLRGPILGHHTFVVDAAWSAR
jgi:hypothetical protein